MGDLIDVVDREANEESSWCWSELPYYLKEDVLACLPVEYLARFSAVCNEWNALFSSTKFITNRWAKAIPNRKPLLIRLSADYKYPSETYCFYTQTWKSFISFNFLQEEESLNYHGSVAGLFLLSVCPYSNAPTYHVCNPLTRTSLQLPPMLSFQTVSSMGIYNCGQNKKIYKVVAVGPQNIEIYDSSTSSWRVAGQVPANLRLLDDKLIISNGICYSLARFRLDNENVIMSFNIADGTSNFASLPLEMQNLAFMLDPQLLTCGSKVLVVGGISEEDQQHLVIWEFQSNSFSWAEIARMPPWMFDTISISISIRCVGVEDNVCIIGEGIAVYNLNQNSWGWLPDFYLYHPINSIMSFEPRLDVNLR